MRQRPAPWAPAFSINKPNATATNGSGFYSRVFGLRTSLIRLKVIDALLTAAESDRSLGVRGVHSHLLDLDIPLSFLSVREVLKRLSGEGVITLNPDKSYSLHPQAAAVLYSEQSGLKA